MWLEEDLFFEITPIPVIDVLGRLCWLRSYPEWVKDTLWRGTEIDKNRERGEGEEERKREQEQEGKTEKHLKY